MVFRSFCAGHKEHSAFDRFSIFFFLEAWAFRRDNYSSLKAGRVEVRPQVLGRCFLLHFLHHSPGNFQHLSRKYQEDHREIFYCQKEAVH